MSKFTYLFPLPEPGMRYRLVFHFSYELNNEPWAVKKKETCCQVTYEDCATRKELEDAANLAEALYRDTPEPEDYYLTKYGKQGRHWATDYYFKPDPEKQISGRVYNTRKEQQWYYRNFIPSQWAPIPNGYIDFKNGEAKYWGYVLLDYQESKIIKVAHTPLSSFTDWKNNLALLDRLFRKPGLVPDNYDWQNGEYEGFLQCFYGNGQNAIAVEDARNEEKKKKKTPSSEKSEENSLPADESLQRTYEDDIADEFEKQHSRELQKALEDRW